MKAYTSSMLLILMDNRLFQYKYTSQLVVCISMCKVNLLNRRIPTGTTVVQTTNDLFVPEIRPKNDTFRPFIRLKDFAKSFGIVQLNTTKQFSYRRSY